MRILHVGSGHPPDHMTAHPVAYTHELSRCQLMQGHRAALFASSPIEVTGGRPYSVFRRTFDGVEVYGVSNRTRIEGFDPAADLSNPDCERAFLNVVQHFRPDVVHFQSVKGLSSSLIPIAKSLGTTVVVSMHDHQHICPKRHLLDAAGGPCCGPEDGRKCAECVLGMADERLQAAFAERRRLLLEWLNGADRVIAPSGSAADLFADQGISPDRIAIVPSSSAVAERLWEQHAASPRSEGFTRFGFAGTIARRNAPHLLVDAVKLLRDLKDRFSVSIRGRIEDERYRREIESAVRNLGPRAPEIGFAGQYNSDVLDELFAGMDVFVAPQVWSNPMSRSTTDALGAGVPVVASMIGSVCEVVGHGYNGLVFDPGNYIDLAAQMRQLIENPVMTATMRANINAPKPMSWHADKVLDLYESAVSVAHADEYAAAQRKAA